MSTYYKQLGIDEKATQSEIKKAYRRMAKKYHPDLNPNEGAQQKFIEIEIAYSCLSKQDSRLAYDRLLKYGESELTNPAFMRKYRNDVNRRASKGRSNANTRTRMTYEQYQRDELLRTSSTAVIIQSIITVIFGAVLAIILYKIAVKMYGPYTREWTAHRSVYVLAGTYVLSLIGLSYVYEPMVRNIIVGKPKK
jgi:curved DNA-binding protein CbpA